MRKPALLFGGPNSGTPYSDDTSWRSTRTWRRRKSTRSTVSPKHSPWRSPRPAATHDQGAVAVGYGRCHGLDLADRQGDDLRLVALGQGDADAWRRCNEPVAHGRLEDRRHPPVGELHGAGRQDDRQLLHPRLDVAATNGTEGPVAEVGVGVQAEVRLHLLDGPRPVNLGRAQLLGVLHEQRAAAGGVDVHAVGDVAPDGVEEALCIALAGEVANLLRPARGLPPSGSVVPVRPLVDARHQPASLSVDPSERPGFSPQFVLSPLKVVSSEDYKWSLSVISGQV